MRTNLPVTQNEYPLDDSTLIVSRTDLDGRLTYFNGQFVEASGFTEEELAGQHHNIVRHPDMPPAAFANLWETLKAGKPWVGAVKNRRKNGDYYWVLATASAITRSGQIVGYTSIRTRLPAEQRREAERVYALLKDGKAKGYRVDAGIIRRTSMFDRFAFLTRSVGARLAVIGLVALSFMAILASVAVYGSVQANASSTVGHSTILVAIAIVMGLGTAAIFTLLVMSSRAMSGPLDRLNSVMFNIAQGSLNNIVHVERDDEIGTALRNVQTVQAIVRSGQEELSATERRTAIERKTDMNKLADGFESAVGQIIETVSTASSELASSANMLTATADRSQQLATSVATSSNQASANVQSVASATEEMASSVQEISRQVQNSAEIARDAVQQAERTDARIAELAKVATRIGDVVELISNIAGQTNLLALNATIEAARAGEAGRGFAVVASEVKALAEQTSRATGEISQQVTSIQSATKESVEDIRQISATIGRMSEISSTIASAVEEQGAATMEISRNVQQASEGTQKVNASVTEVQRGAAETGSASSEVLTAAQSLSAESGRLKDEVGKFLRSVRVG